MPGARILGPLPDTEVRDRRAVLGRRRHLGHEGEVLREGSQVRAAHGEAIENEEPDSGDHRLQPGSPQRILQGERAAGVHPIEALAVAYGLDDVPGLAGASAPTAEDSP